MNNDSSSAVAPTNPNTVLPAWILLIIAWLCFLVPIPGPGLIGMVLVLAADILAIVTLVKGRTLQGVILLLCGVLLSPVVYAIGLAILTALVARPR